MNHQVTTKPEPQTLREIVNGEHMRKQFAMALPKVLPLDAFVRGVMTTLNKTPELNDCAQDTVMAGCMTAASLGLPIDPAIGRAYLIPFWDNKRGCRVAQFVVGYKGMVDLFYRSGQALGIQAEAVYAADHFYYQNGLEPKLEHIPSEAEDRGALRYAYAIGSIKGGGKVWKVLNRQQVMKAKAYSKGSDSSYSPWQTSEAEMWAKTAIRAVADLLPLSTEMQHHMAAIDSTEREYANAIDVSQSAHVSTGPGRLSDDFGTRKAGAGEAQAPREPTPPAGHPVVTKEMVLALARTRSGDAVDDVMQAHELHTIGAATPVQLASLHAAFLKLPEAQS